MNVNISNITTHLLALLAIPSPTGMTERAVSYTREQLINLGIHPRITPKGDLIWTIPGTQPEVQNPSADDQPQHHIAFYGHIDTLGAMVTEIKSNGRLRITQLGDYDWTSIEGARVQVHRRHQPPIEGTVVNTIQSMHAHGSTALAALKRDADTLEIRLNEDTSSAAQTHALGIHIGSYVSFDSQPRLSAGFIEGRHIDNKAAVAIFLETTRALLTEAPRWGTGHDPEIFVR